MEDRLEGSIEGREAWGNNVVLSSCARRSRSAKAVQGAVSVAYQEVPDDSLLGWRW